VQVWATGRYGVACHSVRSMFGLRGKGSQSTGMHVRLLVSILLISARPWLRRGTSATMCSAWDKCRRKGADHLAEFVHPSDLAAGGGGTAADGDSDDDEPAPAPAGTYTAQTLTLTIPKSPSRCTRHHSGHHPHVEAPLPALCRCAVACAARARAPAKGKAAGKAGGGVVADKPRCR
jgi:hypothetical protein